MAHTRSAPLRESMPSAHGVARAPLRSTRTQLVNQPSEKTTLDRYTAPCTASTSAAPPRRRGWAGFDSDVECLAAICGRRRDVHAEEHLCYLPAVSEALGRMGRGGS
ncbi:hypothetical protein VC83_08920 [Pseudogymnoascus destructans]|uniref:Uncharacterized protein n=1 Tax=Pseudogymnoascus destructans TaxID=655981 RepID=A0A176ZZM5_9PEZI|nr:uncharacterized protein VC83_08920 [Pseudogymnoascus destructans]OAF54780.1 hypothetical protein VC83_08920 [Pseudogymnoascus destructans]